MSSPAWTPTERKMIELQRSVLNGQPVTIVVTPAEHPMFWRALGRLGPEEAALVTLKVEG